MLATAVIALAGSAVASGWWKLDRDPKSPSASMTRKNGLEVGVGAGSIVQSPFSEVSGAKARRSTSASKRERRNDSSGGGDLSTRRRSGEAPRSDDREVSLPLRARGPTQEYAILDVAPEAVRAIPGGESKHGHLISGGNDSRFKERGRSATTMNSLAKIADGPGTFLESPEHRRRIDEVDDAVFPLKPVAPGRRARREWKYNRGPPNRREIIKVPNIMFEHGDMPRRAPPDYHDNFGAAYQKPTREVNASAHGTCSSGEIVGLEKCPELEGAVGEMLAAKADMLRRIVDVLSDPSSSGTGGDPDKPLLLVQKLALDETDAVFGAFDRPFVNVVTDAAGWSPLPGGFNRWVERYYREVLHRTRPVIVTVHVRSFCSM